MKLATLKNGRKDGRLVLVSRDLQRAVAADDIAPSMLDAIAKLPVTEDQRDGIRYGNAAQLLGIA